MAFLRDLPTGVQSFGIQSFAWAESDRAERGTGCSRGAVDWRIACEIAETLSTRSTGDRGPGKSAKRRQKGG